MSSQEEQQRYKTFSRRSFFLGAGMGGLFATLMGRMYYLQVLESDKYKVLAEKNRISVRLIAPIRGEIVDRDGRPLADNRQTYRAILIPDESDDQEKLLKNFARILDLGDEEQKRIDEQVFTLKGRRQIAILENLAWNEVGKLELNAVDLPGIVIETGLIRNYPQGPAFSHILGYVGAPPKELATKSRVFTLPGFKIGQSGIEKFYDADLRGIAGTRQLEVNAMGRVVRELNREKGQAGRNLVLTIERDLQIFAQHRLSQELSAAAVVMEIETGEILAMASSPAFDGSLFTTGISHMDWNALRNNPYNPLLNKACNGTYSPGSTFKPVVAMAALKAGIDPNKTFYCPGHLSLGRRRFHCWKRYGHGHMTMHEAIAESCDVYFYEVSQLVGVDAIAAMANTFGLGQPSGIDLPSEEKGIIPTQAWKQAVIGEKWQLGETLNVSIGQGFVLTTPLQLAVMTARLVNGGKAVRPRLLLSKHDPWQPLAPTAIPPEQDALLQTPQMDVSLRHLDIVRDAMDAVVNNKIGTAKAARIKEEGFEMGGKTGTSQVRRISKSERVTGVVKNEDLDWRWRDHALFVGFAPVHKPRFAVSVLVEHGGSGSAAAAPIARDLLLHVQKSMLLRNRGDAMVDTEKKRP